MDSDELFRKEIIDGCAFTFAKWPVTWCGSRASAAAGASSVLALPSRRPAGHHSGICFSPGQEYVKGERENARKRGRFYASAPLDRIGLIKAEVTFLDSFPECCSGFRQGPPFHDESEAAANTAQRPVEEKPGVDGYSAGNSDKHKQGNKDAETTA